MVVKKPVRKRSVKKTAKAMKRLTIDNMSELVRTHPGEFAATDADGHVVAFGDTPTEATRRARKKGEKEPFLIRISETNCAWVF